MPTKREVLDLLKRDELLAAIEQYQIDVSDRRARESLVDALAASRRVDLSGVLADLSRDRLKEACRALALDDGGREKSLLIDRLTMRDAPANEPITREQIDDLLRFLPMLEVPGTQHVERWDGGETNDGAMTIPYPVYTRETQEFWDRAMQPCWCDYGYDPVEAGDMLADAELMPKANLEQIRTMLTYCARGERFCEGHWDTMLSSGKVLTLLRRLQQLRETVSALGTGTTGTAMVEAFMWGYWGWGGSTRELVESFDAAEKARGFKPPLFVDARVRRAVRAVGFRGDAFEKKYGSGRYRWMRGLGNRGVLEGGGTIELMDEGEIGDLLDEIIASHRVRRRVIFFCACQTPRNDGERSCHRDLICELLLKEARRRKLALSVSEWPGGQPRRVIANFAPSAAAATLGTALSVPTPGDMEPSVAVALPWGSYAMIDSPEGPIPLILGPAIHKNGRWALQLPWEFPSHATTEAKLQRHILSLVKSSGFDARYSLPSAKPTEVAWQELVVAARPGRRSRSQ